MTASNDHFHFEYISDCLNIRALSRYLITQKEEAFQTLVAAFKARPIKAALVDLRAVPGPYSFSDRVRLGELVGYYLRGTPIAVVMTAEQVDPERIGKMIARNLGANLEVFLEEAEARAWVGKYLNP